MTLNSKRARAKQLSDKLEAELRRLAAWRDSPLPPEAMQFTLPFGGDTMPFEHWIQFVLIPRLREISTGNAAIPPSSNLAGYAVREFDGRDREMAGLIGLLYEVDEICPQPITPASPRLGAVMLLVFAVFGWAAVSIFCGYAIAGWVAEKRPQRTLLFANFAGTSRGALAGLVFQAWTWKDATSDSLRGETADLTITPFRNGGKSESVQRVLHIELSANPPNAVQTPENTSVDWSAAGLSTWAGRDGTRKESPDPISFALFNLLSSLNAGMTENAARAQLQRIGHLLGADQARAAVDIKHYAVPVSTAVFLGSFAAMFLPPTVTWMVFQYRRNLRRQRGLS